MVPGCSTTSLFQVWPPDQQHWHPLGSCYGVKFAAPVHRQVQVCKALFHRRLGKPRPGLSLRAAIHKVPNPSRSSPPCWKLLLSFLPGWVLYQQVSCCRGGVGGGNQELPPVPDIVVEAGNGELSFMVTISHPGSSTFTTWNRGLQSLAWKRSHEPPSRTC